MTQKERALKKLHLELKKDIDKATIKAKECGILELIYFVFKLHWIRLLPKHAIIDQTKKEVVEDFSNFTEDSIKYIISLISKFGNWKLKITKEGIPMINIPLLYGLQDHCNYINSKYESESLIQLHDVSVSGKRDQNMIIDFSNIDSNPEVKSYFDYFGRIDEDNNVKTRSKINQFDLIQEFKKEYSPFSDLFFQEIGITINDYCFLIEKLLTKVTDCLKIQENKFIKLDNGNIDLTTIDSFYKIINCFLFKKSNLLVEFESKFHPVINKLIFNIDQFEEKQLRYHLVTRQPLLSKFDDIILSPELILDSIFTNIHYSLIESIGSEDSYKARQSSIFLNKLVNIANNYGYNEINRELDLYDGKNKIGDIDLILKHETGKYLLIEAKNHNLPLDVYFKDVNKTKEHLKYLQSDWEKKVKRRIEHLKNNYGNYSITENYEYMVVSRFPEIISHFTDLFVLSIQEFEDWLSKHSEINSFIDFHKIYYDSREPKYSVEEIEDFQKANILFGKFKK